MILTSRAIVIPNTPSLTGPFLEANNSNGNLNLLETKKISSRVLELRLESTKPIEVLRLVGCGAVYWDDFWTDSRGRPADPRVKSIEMQNSVGLEVVNISYERAHLTRVDLSGCLLLEHLSLVNCPALTALNLESCKGLREIYLGFNKNIRQFSLRDCNLSEHILEAALAAYIPTRAEAFNEGRTIRFECYVDLRGNYIPWDNRRIASKLRMLLANKVAVAWSNNPPEAVIPAELYRNLNL